MQNLLDGLTSFIYIFRQMTSFVSTPPLEAPLEKYSTQDALADARREFRAWYFIPNALAGIVWATAVFWVLPNPDLSDSARTLWEILPWPFLVVGLIGWIARERRLDELSRAVSQKAATIAWNVTVFYLMGMTLMDASGYTLEWKWAIFWPLFFYSNAWMWVHKRTVGS